MYYNFESGGSFESNGFESTDYVADESNNFPDANTYNNLFPALPNSGGLTNEVDNNLHRFRITTTEVTQAFCIPAEELRYDSESEKFGEGESVRVCMQIMKETGATIEISTSKDKSLTFLITGKPNNVLEAKRRVISSFQTQANLTISVPKDHHRAILGKSGERLKQLEKTTGTKIIIPSLNNVNEQIIVTGSREGIEKASHEIRIISDEKSKNFFMRLTIPKEFHPFIAGPNNKIVNDLMQRTGTRINIPPGHLNKDEITITGEKNMVECAKNGIEEVYRFVETNDQVVRIPVDKSKHKYVTGYRRSGIIDIFNLTGVSIEVPTADDPSDTIVLRGPKSSVSEALQIVLQRAESVKHEVLNVPNRYHKFIIGRKGSSIREIHSNYKEVHIEFSEDTITIEGPTEQFDYVKNLIVSKVEYYSEYYKFTDIQIDPQYIKHIIGKNGVNLNRIKSEYGVSISIPETSNDTIHIEGTKECVMNAEMDLKKTIKKLESQTEYILKIDPKYHREIIGSKGERIKEIQENFNVTIHFPSPNQTEDKDSVKLRGDAENAISCQRYIGCLIKDIDEANYTLTVPIYKKFHKFVIGKGGANIKRIKEETNTRIEFPEESDMSDQIIISGKKEQVEIARDRIQKIQNEMENITTTEVTVPVKFHSMLRSGKITQAIKKECGLVTIKVPPQGAGNNDKVTIRGPLEDVRKAKQQLLNIVTDLQVNSFSVNILVEATSIKYLNEKYAQKIRKIMDNSGVRILIPDERIGPDTISITGKKEEVLKSKEKIQEFVNKIDSYVEEEVDVDPEFHKYFMVSKQELLKTIIDKCGGDERLSIKFKKLNKSPTVIVEGHEESVKSAVKIINDEVEQFKLYTSLKVEVNRETMKFLLFRNKEVLNNIRKECNVYIMTEKPPPNNGNLKHKPDEKDSSVEQLTIFGFPENCKEAEQAILDVLPVTKEIAVPHNLHGFLIGRSGHNITEMVGSTDVYVEMPHPDEKSDIVKVKGNPNKIDEVIEKLLKRVEELQHGFEDKKQRSFELKFQVDPSYHPHIIGRKGERIAKLRAAYNVLISLPTKEQVGCKDITIVGSKENAEAAKRDILSMIGDLEKKHREFIKIDPRVHSRMIGLQGKFVKELIGEYNVEIRFPRFDGGDRSQDFVTITGEEKRVKDCKIYMLFLETEFLKDLGVKKENTSNGIDGVNHEINDTADESIVSDANVAAPEEASWDEQATEQLSNVVGNKSPITNNGERKKDSYRQKSYWAPKR